MTTDLGAMARKEREARAGGADSGQAKTEDVVRMFSDIEKMDILAADGVNIEIGSPPIVITLFPLSTRQLLQALPRIRQYLAPLMAAFKNRNSGDVMPIGVLIDGLAENVAELPELIETILMRGNVVSKEFIMDNLNFFPDMAKIVPVFLKQNGLDKMFGLGKRVAPLPSSSNGAEPRSETSAEATPISASPESSTSPVGTTSGDSPTP